MPPVPWHDAKTLCYASGCAVPVALAHLQSILILVK